MKTIPRNEAAAALVEAIDGAGLDGRIWTGAKALRVYVQTEPGRKGKDCGYLQIEADGSLSQNWTKRRFELERLVATWNAEHTVLAVETSAVAPERKDEDEQDFEGDRTARGERE